MLPGLSGRPRRDGISGLASRTQGRRNARRADCGKSRAEALRILDAAYLGTHGNQLRLKPVRLYETPSNWADTARLARPQPTPAIEAGNAIF